MGARASFIEGYAGRLSAAPGERIPFHISTTAAHYRMEIARLGRAREVVWEQEGLPGARHPVPSSASTRGCAWPVALEVEVPQAWRSGCYSVVLQGDEAGECSSEMSFVVRSAHPGRDTSILMQLTTNTYNAYNTYGGANLYRGPEGPARRVSFERPEARLPGLDGVYFFDLPDEVEEELDRGLISEQLQAIFQQRAEECRISSIELTLHGEIFTHKAGREWEIVDPFGAGPLSYQIKKQNGRIQVYNATSAGENGWRNWEYPFVAWAEGQGYRMDFAVNADLEFRPEILASYKLVLSVGHDEYWSAPMRDHLEAFIGAGGNVAFFSGNAVYWQVRFEDEGRSMVCWKNHEQDPLYRTGDHRLLSTLWCHRLIGRPENQLTGVSFAYGGYSRFFDQFRDAPGGYTVHRPEHWIFAGTGLQEGDLLGVRDKIVSYECDGCDLEWHAGRPVPTCRDGTPESFQVLATAPAALTSFDQSLEMMNAALYEEGAAKEHPQPGAAVLGLYERGGTVVTCGCTHWASGLRGNDPTVEQITRNILARLSV